MSKKINDILMELKEFGVDISDVTINIEPENTYKKIIDLEKEYNLNTNTILCSSDYLLLKQEVINNWKNLYLRFIDFGGNKQDLDTISIRIEYDINYLLITKLKSQMDYNPERINIKEIYLNKGGLINPPLLFLLSH